MPQGSGKSTGGNGSVTLLRAVTSQDGSQEASKVGLVKGGSSNGKQTHANGANGHTTHVAVGIDRKGLQAEVVDFVSARETKMDEKRRRTERTLFHYMMGVYSVMGGQKLAAIELIDVSEQGIAFEVPHDPLTLLPVVAETVPLRLYFSQDTFLEIFVTVKNSRASVGKFGRTQRFGCEVDQQTAS